ncbi:hypothetical protein CFC21_094042 [Triticum aestivum]|uniref:DUF1618 domain-containing protein n=2 Tax=Triticum aestivum TaxID=4565 RepID=A0A3B6QMD8_WHEAT|nr:uncharacterized protein LOC123141935 [Triticum aestivum]KAF7091467.1 hypothetical protein CFC21_094042 [Triticum aestivum]
MKRRFVNLVTQNWTEGVYSVRRIDPYHHFFYGSADAALRAAAAEKTEPFPAMRIKELPTPCMNFTAAGSHGGTLDMFALYSPRATGDGRIVYTDMMGNAGLYDAGRHVHTALSRLNERKGPQPMCLSIAHPDADEEDNLYVLDTYPGDRGCFEVLERTRRRFRCRMMPQWHWRLLPPPPFVRQPLYRPSSVTSFTTMVDGDGCSTIYISCAGAGGVDVGTYSYETPRHEYSEPRGWRHVGEWMLPFRGRAHYVPEFNLWFGFSASSPDDHLCAADLSAMDGGRQPSAPTVWEDLNPPDEGEAWLPKQLELLHLGGGKFLIAKTFTEGERGGYFSVLTGVEMMACAAGDDRQQTLQMVKHKCARFVFTDEHIERVL